jgi:hypothetical protein
MLTKDTDVGVILRVESSCLSSMSNAESTATVNLQVYFNKKRLFSKKNLEFGFQIPFFKQNEIQAKLFGCLALQLFQRCLLKEKKFATRAISASRSLSPGIFTKSRRHSEGQRRLHHTAPLSPLSQVSFLKYRLENFKENSTGAV